MNDIYPTLSHGDTAQVNDPQISQASCDHQIAQAFWVRHVTFVKKEPTTFHIGEEGFNLETLFVPVQGFIGQFEISHQIDRVLKTPFPSGHHRDWAVASWVNQTCGIQIWSS